MIGNFFSRERVVHFKHYNSVKMGEGVSFNCHLLEAFGTKNGSVLNKLPILHQLVLFSDKVYAISFCKRRSNSETNGYI